MRALVDDAKGPVLVAFWSIWIINWPKNPFE
jgi:hypothetical protein